LSSADTEEQQAAVEVDDAHAAADADRQQVLDELKAALGDAIVESHVGGGDLWVRVGRDDWRRAVEACKAAGFGYFDFLSGLDWMPSAPNPEDAETLSVEPDADEDEAPDPEPGESPDEQTHEEASPAGTVAAFETAEGEPDDGWVTGVGGGETRFQVFARFHSLRRKVGVTIKADLDDESPAVASIHDIFFGAEWHERETWEMYGFLFEGHPDLRHIYLPGEFEGFPLRKDFPLLAREVKPWPGIVDVEDLPAAEEARQDAAINAAQEGEASEGDS
jgi:NADH-quinone oxidoreductase subunit C